jgi:hypothetical protein
MLKPELCFWAVNFVILTFRYLNIVVRWAFKFGLCLFFKKHRTYFISLVWGVRYLCNEVGLYQTTPVSLPQQPMTVRTGVTFSRASGSVDNMLLLNFLVRCERARNSSQRILACDGLQYAKGAYHSRRIGRASVTKLTDQSQQMYSALWLQLVWSLTK